MARSMVNQNLLLQREATPGTPLITAMKRVLGLKVMPGWEVETEDFKASGSKVITSTVVNTEMGAPTVEAIQDYNAFTWLLTGGFGAPVSSLVATTTGSYQHVYTLSSAAADPLVTFTGMWGDASFAIQMPYFVFTSLSLEVSSGSLSVDTSAMSREPVTGIAMPTTGITTIGSQPLARRTWDVWSDTTWAALGTTKLLAAYAGSVDFGDKYTPDYTINSANSSFESLLESEDTDYTGNLTLGFDAAALAHIASYKAGALKFIRLKSTGPIIEGTTPYSIQIDLCVRITSPGEIGTGDSPAVQLPFDFNLTVDPTTSNVARATLVNTVSTL